jgi:hypothetical protein
MGRNYHLHAFVVTLHEILEEAKVIQNPSQCHLRPCLHHQGFEGSISKASLVVLRPYRDHRVALLNEKVSKGEKSKVNM